MWPERPLSKAGYTALLTERGMAPLWGYLREIGALEVLEEVPDDASVDVLEVEPGWGLAGTVLNKGEEQPEGVPVGCDGMRARLALLGGGGR